MVNFDNETIKITGENFDIGPNPTMVSLGDFGNLNISTNTSNMLVVDFPPGGIAPGTYLLSVFSGPGPKKNAQQSLTIGTQGPQGDMGDQGDQGTQGPPGPRGPVGPTGATGPQGPVGPPGPKGDVGPEGPPGPAGGSGFQVVDANGLQIGELVDADVHSSLVVIDHSLGLIPVIVTPPSNIGFTGSGGVTSRTVYESSDCSGSPLGQLTEEPSLFEFETFVAPKSSPTADFSDITVYIVDFSSPSSIEAESFLQFGVCFTIIPPRMEGGFNLIDIGIDLSQFQQPFFIQKQP